MSKFPRRVSRGAVAAAVTPVVVGLLIKMLEEHWAGGFFTLIALGAAAAGCLFVLTANGTGRERFWRTFCYAITCTGLMSFGPSSSRVGGYYDGAQLLAIHDECPMWMALLFGSAAGTGLAFTIWPPRGGTTGGHEQDRVDE